MGHIFHKVVEASVSCVFRHFIKQMITWTHVVAQSPEVVTSRLACGSQQMVLLCL